MESFQNGHLPELGISQLYSTILYLTYFNNCKTIHLFLKSPFDQLINFNTTAFMKPQITIVYCPKCGWLLRAAYMAQEFLTTFVADIQGVTLQPGEINGHFYILINDQKIFDRKVYGGFPEITTLKQLVRDVVNPEKKLGHADKKPETDL